MHLVQVGALAWVQRTSVEAVLWSQRQPCPLIVLSCGTTVYADLFAAPDRAGTDERQGRLDALLDALQVTKTAIRPAPRRSA